MYLNRIKLYMLGW